jgi:kynurenine formamidase
MRDLTHVFRQGFPVGGYDSPCRENLASLQEEGFSSHRWSFAEHSGTHVDAPSHFSPDGVNADRIPLSDLVVTVAVIDVTARVADDPDTASRWPTSSAASGRMAPSARRGSASVVRMGRARR